MKLSLQHGPDDLVLRDIHLPPTPPWWPPAPGWWVLLGMLCVLLAAAFFIYRRTRRRRVWRTRVLAEIQAISIHHPHDDIAFATSLHQLLRRVACLYAVDAHQVQGERWREILGQVPVDEATLDMLMTLETRMYRPRAEFDRDGLQAAVHRWMQSALRSTKLTEPRHV
ncbi:DUF4381 family protein [Dyella psychrodurans]|uniref:DUF4381 family protein n=1 Tax=Dyella psychrodurans TaxID=1927960 RepID=A0A370X2M4_9GAMM|nr:DUF4381 family protein [Dyella psychrodurans]RDS82547.1 DUF4381 family protein [Dyella psychrodurans]